MRHQINLAETCGVGVRVPGEIKVRWHRALPGKPKSAIVPLQGGSSFPVCHIEALAQDRAMSSLIALSNGKTFRPQNWD